MPEIFVEGGRFLKRCVVAVDAPVEVTLLDKLPEQLHVRSLSSTNDRRPNRHAVPLHTPENVIDDLLNGSTGNLFSTTRAVGFANSGPKETEVVLDFSDRSHG